MYSANICYIKFKGVQKYLRNSRVNLLIQERFSKFSLGGWTSRGCIEPPDSKYTTFYCLNYTPYTSLDFGSRGGFNVLGCAPRTPLFTRCRNSFFVFRFFKIGFIPQKYRINCTFETRIENVRFINRNLTKPTLQSKV